MAKCKRCKTNIPDGAEYCKDCLDKEKVKANESYLDSLLNSVKNTAPATESIYKKKNDLTTETSQLPSDPSPEEDFPEDDMFRFDLGDIEEFDKFNIEEDLAALGDDAIVGDKELFGEDLSELLKEEATGAIIPADMQGRPATDSLQEEQRTNILEDTGISEAEPVVKASESGNQAEDKPDAEALNINSSEINDYPGDDGLDTDLNDLLNQLDSVGGDSSPYDTSEAEQEKVPSDDAKQESDAVIRFDEEPVIAASGQEDANDINQEEEDDFLSLLNQISADDPVAGDIKEISELMKETQAPKGSVMPSDVGEVFSDALKAVSNLNDPNLDEDALLSTIPDKKAKKGKKKKEKIKKEKKTSDKQPSENEEEQPKKSVLKRLFGNVEEKGPAKKKPVPQSAFGGETAEPENKKTKSKKGKKGKAGEEEETQDAGKKGNAKSAEDEEPENKKQKKKVKKEKKKKSNDIIQVIDEIDEEDVGRINRLGAMIVFVFFGLLALLIYVGSNAVTYTLSIQHATSYFNKQKYNEAYDQVYGMTIDDEDVEIYSKIMTVMFVNKQLNSYNNYCVLGKYPQALDSLLKGLKRYDKYIELATLFGIKPDLDYVREHILAELKNRFNLSEEDALNINRIDDSKEYSLKVYDVAMQNQ